MSSPKLATQSASATITDSEFSGSGQTGLYLTASSEIDVFMDGLTVTDNQEFGIYGSSGMDYGEMEIWNSTLMS